MNILALALLFLAAVVGGAINSVAGGGTLISFPSLVVFGVDRIVANATNTAALWPGTIGGVWGYRHDLKPLLRLLPVLLLPSLAGGLLGALLLTRTPPELFGRIVPALVLFATVIFALRDVFNRIAQRSVESMRRADEGHLSLAARVWGVLFQLFVATYGGYFGAGIGILMLASLSLMGLQDIHRMNALKSSLAFVINGVALLFFALSGIVEWSLAILMGIGGLLGGYLGAKLAKRVNQEHLRAFVVVMGLAATVYLYVRAL
ncbi:MAG: sulfite exporter TauE/SafE family protein [Anaerolineae bacterium]|nr:sulfite exporter TauE/SafE family protein [Thermoflexales bacterium]MDW8395255.1 sulfite exporter TauE/SafE family protein [Anaerolineae bacterium]